VGRVSFVSQNYLGSANVVRSARATVMEPYLYICVPGAIALPNRKCKLLSIQ
jgi:hypothetical protein